MKILYYVWLPLLVSGAVLYTASNSTIGTCLCPQQCENVWRGDHECDQECNIAACHWDNGDCNPRGHYDGKCLGNATIKNRDTKQEVNGLCDQWAKMRRTCEDRDHLGLDLPWQLQTDDCRWEMNAFIPHPSMAGNRCHSLIPCVSDKWCQTNCANNIKIYPQKCAWDLPKPVWVPTPFPTKRPSKRPTKRPTKKRTKRPTPYPTKFPTRYPTIYPTFIPTLYPTANPTVNPTVNPTANPTRTPSNIPPPPHTHGGDQTHTTHHTTTNNSYSIHPVVACVGIVVGGLIVVTGCCLYYRRQKLKEYMSQWNGQLNARRLQNQQNYPPPAPMITVHDNQIIRGEPLEIPQAIELPTKRFTKVFTKE